jgi:hypothetical protein
VALAGLRQGFEYLKPSSNQRYTPFISWSDGEAKTVLFLTPAEEIPKVRIHNFVKVAADNEKGFAWRTFMCRKDPAWAEESHGECYLCDVVGHKAGDKWAAIAVELEAVTEGTSKQIKELRVKTREAEREDGTKVQYPVTGIVLQGFRNFFNYLTAYAQKWGSINDVAFDIVRMGNDQSTSYPFDSLKGVPLPDLTPFEDNLPSLYDALEQLGSAERYKSELQGIENIEQEQLGNDVPAPAGTDGTEMRTKFDDLAAKLQGGKVEQYQTSETA